MKSVAIIPTHKAKGLIQKTVSDVTPYVDAIYVIDDACPDNSTEEIQTNPKVTIIHHSSNKGVGGAMKTGYEQALKDSFDVFIKIDADSQMDVTQIPNMIKVLTEQNCDFVKGDRLSNKKNRKGMPSKRLFGNRSLSFVVRHLSKTKKINDVTNGFTAISSQALRKLSLDNLDDRYYFEISMIFELSRISAKVVDIPMPSIYNDEVSGLSIVDTLIKFPPKLICSYLKRNFETVCSFIYEHIIKIKYLSVSGASLALDYLGIYLLMTFVPALPVGMVVSLAHFISVLFNFTALRLLVFSSDGATKHVLIKYILLLVLANIITVMGVGLLLNYIDNVYASKTIILIVLMPIVYVINKKYIFNHAEGQD